MMNELSEYDNLIKAMGALFYTSKKMGEVIPCVFQSWKEFAFESRAKKIHNFLSNEKKQKAQEAIANFDLTQTMGGPGEVDFSQRMVLRGLSSAATGGDAIAQHLGKDGMTI